MNTRTKTGLAIVQAALILGVVGDVLLRATPWGANVLLFNVLFSAAMLMLLRRFKSTSINLQTISLIGAMVFFSSMFALRDSMELRVADTFAIIAILSILILPQLKVTMRLAGVFHYFIGALWSAANAGFAPAALLGADIDWKTIPQSGVSRHLFSILRGVAIATPILLIFGGLFVAADAVYQGWVERIFNVKPEIIVTHVLLTGVFAWISAGYLRGVMIGNIDTFESAPLTIVTDEAPTASKVADIRDESADNPSALPNNRSAFEHLSISDPPNAAEPPSSAPAPASEPEKKPFEWSNFENTLLPPVFTLGTVEIAVVLGLVNLLFLSFVIVQVPYLFGGMELVQNTPDFKLASYARRGFGELVTVAGLVLPILLASHWLIKKESRVTATLFRVLAGIQIALLLVIMASAAQRLFLLTGNLGYGLTTIRLYPMIFMSWLAVVFVWFALTVLRGQRKHFAWGALWAAFIILAGTHFLNPDAYIAKTNIALMNQGRGFDASYHNQLSDDAVPVLIDSFNDLSESDQQIVVRHLARRACESKNEADLRSWNFSRRTTGTRLNSNQELMNNIGDCERWTRTARWDDDF